MEEISELLRRRAAASQQQFLEVVDADVALQRFRDALAPAPLGSERVPLAQALQRVVAEDISAPLDVPGFDRANVDGFALRAEDTVGASEARPRVLRLNREVLTPGVAPTLPLTAQQATVIATGGMLPRGADAVVMVEDTELAEQDGEPVVWVRRALSPGRFISFAGTDVGRGETILRAGQRLGSREIGVLAALGLAEVVVYRRPRVAVFSTGDELVVPGEPLSPGKIYDSNGPIIAAALTELGCEPVPLGIAADQRQAQQTLLQTGLEYDGVILSGGTSKGAGDLSYQMVSALNDPGVVVHGVAIKPGKPLCLAVSQGKPVVILPGFPTSAMFTFHQFVAPVLRQLAGLPAGDRETLPATLPLRASSERGRAEYLLVSLMPGPDGLAAYPMGKGSGSVTAFSHADGFIRIEPQAEVVPAGTAVQVQLLSRGVEAADLVCVGSHCLGLDYLLGRLQQEGWRVKSLYVGSQGGLAAARRGECDIAGMHLLDPQSGEYNRPFLSPGLELLAGYGRLQGLVFRPDDARFQGVTEAQQGLTTALADQHCVMVNRNPGSGTRVLIDQLLGEARPMGYPVQTRSHNAVAAAVAQGRADWGVAIDTVARLYGLGFLPLTHEHYDFVIPEARWERPAVQRLRALLQEPAAQTALRGLGFSLS